MRRCKEEKMDIIPGKVGIWTFDFDRQSMAQVREEVAELEALGYGAIWIPEVAGREALTHAAVLLAATNCLARRRSLLSNTLLCLKLTHTRRDESLALILRPIFSCLLIWRNSGDSASLTTILLRGEAIVLWTHL